MDKNTIEELKNLAKNMTQLLKSKAENQEIVELQNSKTNKLDTENLIQRFDVMYKQLENLSVLVSQVLK